MADDAGDRAPKPVREAARAALRDLHSLEEDGGFKAQKVQFLLDAALGLISLAQNDIIKLFSVLAVISMPPTVIVSVYGMNFKAMPELEFRLSVRGLLHAVCLGAALLVLPLEKVAVRALKLTVPTIVVSRASLRWPSILAGSMPRLQHGAL